MSARGAIEEVSESKFPPQSTLSRHPQDALGGISTPKRAQSIPSRSTMTDSDVQTQSKSIPTSAVFHAYLSSGVSPARDSIFGLADPIANIPSCSHSARGNRISAVALAS